MGIFGGKDPLEIEVLNGVGCFLPSQLAGRGKERKKERKSIYIAPLYSV